MRENRKEAHHPTAQWIKKCVAMFLFKHDFKMGVQRSCSKRNKLQGKQGIKTLDAITQCARQTVKDERCCFCLTVAEYAKKPAVIQKLLNETHTHLQQANNMLYEWDGLVHCSQNWFAQTVTEQLPITSDACISNFLLSNVLLDSWTWCHVCRLSRMITRRLGDDWLSLVNYGWPPKLDDG